MPTPQIIHLVFHGKPYSVNQTYQIGRGKYRGKMFLRNEAKNYGEGVGWEARKQYRGKPLTSPLEVIFNYYFSNKRRHDHLNHTKILCDRLNQIVWQDDSQILISHHYTHYDKVNPRVELFIKEIQRDQTNDPTDKPRGDDSV